MHHPDAPITKSSSTANAAVIVPASTSASSRGNASGRRVVRIINLAEARAGHRHFCPSSWPWRQFEGSGRCCQVGSNVRSNNVDNVRCLYSAALVRESSDRLRAISVISTRRSDGQQTLLCGHPHGSARGLFRAGFRSNGRPAPATIPWAKPTQPKPGPNVLVARLQLLPLEAHRRRAASLPRSRLL